MDTDAADCESRGTAMRGLVSEGSAPGCFRDQVGRLTAPVEGKGVLEGGRSAAGWLLSVDEHCRRIDLSTGGYEA